MNVLLPLLLILTAYCCCSAAPEADLVETLPLFGPPPTPHYSGYLDGTPGCNTGVNGASCKIHYWFTAAQGGDDWQSKPVVLWLNGGPGGSSIMGMVQENGPLLINATGGLMENPYSWNTVANFFVIESPVGVGFSYCEAQLQGKTCANTDKYTASTARAAIVDFFGKFSELQGNDFFITGESYAGVYIPTLSYELLQYNAAHPDNVINLKGLAVGDPCTDNDSQRESMDSLWYARKYGLVDNAVYDTLHNQCNIRLPNYHMLSEQEQTGSVEATRNNMTPECTLALRKYLLSSSHGIAGHWGDGFVDRYSLFAPVTDVVDVAMEAYFNREDTKQALHVTETPNPKWTKHAVNQDYTKEYDACNRFADEDAVSMLDFYRKIVPKLDIVWIYNGDADPAVSYEGTRTAVKRIGFSELDGGSYRPWFYNHTAASLQTVAAKPVMFGPDLLLQGTGAQFGGEVVNYELGLAFLTVHGSGHMVPQFRPQAALHMIQKLVAYQDLSPLLPLNETLAKMSNQDFSDAMDTWTEQAKAAPFVVAADRTDGAGDGGS